MAIKMKFDLLNNPEKPTLTLATRNGTKLGGIKAEGIIVNDKMNDASEISFKVRKFVDNEKCKLWDKIVDFKLLWCREWDMWFQIKVELDEATETVKTVYCTQLGQAELSQINLHNIEINTETDIARDDYVSPTVLFNETNHEASLLHRIMEKAPHYSFIHVDSTIANIQRTFSFNGISIYDAFKEISEEIGCIFILHSNSDKDGNIQRTISVYDLENNCLACNHRGEFASVCPECGSTDINLGYGEDTTIFVSSEELADDIQFVTDDGSVKNCFKLEAGDDLMTATIRNCNPNGTDYIWYLSDSIKEDMSYGLQRKIESYNSLFAFFQNEYEAEINCEQELLLSKNREGALYVGKDIQVGNVLRLKCLVENVGKEIIDYIHSGGEIGHMSFEPTDSVSIKYVSMDILIEEHELFYINEYVEAYLVSNGDSLSQYNSIVAKYKTYNDNLKQISSPIKGYPNLMTAYYNTVDLAVYLQSELMPDASMSDTNAVEQASLLTASSLSPVSVTDVSIISLATADSAVLAMAKVIIDSRYKVKINNSSLNSQTWTGNFIITNYSDEEDVAISSNIAINLDDDYESYVKQKLEKVLNKNNADNVSIIGLFEMEYDAFCNELKKYCLSRLESFNNACQSCIDILIEQGVADKESWSGSESDLYSNLYLPYYNKLSAIQQEILYRESELSIVLGTLDKDGYIESYGLQNCIVDIKNDIQEILNFENFLGENLWLEFCSYRREDTYSNENYISDGLNNAELFNKALEFIEVANKEIYKSAELQHSISTTLKNLLVMKKFEPLVEYFEIGNWIRVQVDDRIYKLRLIEYEIDYDNLSSISVDFSDVMKTADGEVDQRAVIEQATSMATSYSSVQKQAKQGQSSKSQLENWVKNGLALTNMKIIGNADNQNVTWDSHGILCREHLPITDSYDDKQLKIINRGLYLTDDNWKTSRAGIGNFAFYNPETGLMEESYGVIADTLIGNLILSEKVGIYNKNNSITLDEKGLTITTEGTLGDSESVNQNALTIQKKTIEEDGTETIEQVMYIDEDGNLVLNGSIRINSSVNTDLSTINDLADTSNLSEEISNAVNNELHRLPDENIEGDTGGVYSTIEAKYNDVRNYSNSILDGFKTELKQYLDYDENGLVLGCYGSDFSTLINNTGMYFRDGDKTTAYVTNKQLHIPEAIIDYILVLGNFFFSPHANEDGGFSITWQE